MFLKKIKELIQEQKKNMKKLCNFKIKFTLFFTQGLKVKTRGSCLVKQFRWELSLQILSSQTVKIDFFPKEINFLDKKIL